MASPRHRIVLAFFRVRCNTFLHPPTTMNINTLPRDEMASHLAEVIDSQDSKLIALHQEKRVLWLLLAAITTFHLIF